MSAPSKAEVMGEAIPEVMVAIPVNDDAILVAPAPGTSVTQGDAAAQQQAQPPAQPQGPKKPATEALREVGGLLGGLFTSIPLFLIGLATLFITFLMIGAMTADYLTLKATVTSLFFTQTVSFSLALDDMECSGDDQDDSEYCAGQGLLGTSICFALIASFCFIAAGFVQTKILGLIGGAIGAFSWPFLFITPIVVRQRALEEIDDYSDASIENEDGFGLNITCIIFLPPVIAAAIYYSFKHDKNESEHQDAPPVVGTPVVAGAGV